MTRPTHEIPSPGTTVDGTGLLCVTLLLRLRKEIAGAEPGTVVHVIATDPAAPLDLPAWCHMTGHHYLGRVGDLCQVAPVAEDRRTYALRLTAGARATRPDAPWRTAETPVHPPGEVVHNPRGRVHAPDSVCAPMPSPD